MKLTTILNELHGQYSTFRLCMDGYVPLSLPLIKKLVKPTKKIVFHMTDVDHLTNLHRMEGKSKAISAFTKASGNPFFNSPLAGDGMWTNGGVLVVLSGIVLAESWGDLWTVVDENGRRWAKPDTLIHREFEGRIIDSADKRTKELKEKHLTQKPLTNEEKNEFITGYINTAYKVLLKNKSFFQKKYNTPAMLPLGEYWNELVVSKIKVEQIYIITDHSPTHSKQKQRWALKNYKNAKAIKVKDIGYTINKWVKK